MEVDTAKDKAKPEKEGGLFGWWGSVVAKVKGITDQPEGEASSSDAAQQEQSEAAPSASSPTPPTLATLGSSMARTVAKSA